MRVPLTPHRRPLLYSPARNVIHNGKTSILLYSVAARRQMSDEPSTGSHIMRTHEIIIILYAIFFFFFCLSLHIIKYVSVRWKHFSISKKKNRVSRGLCARIAYCYYCFAITPLLNNVPSKDSYNFIHCQLKKKKNRKILRSYEIGKAFPVNSISRVKSAVKFQNIQQVITLLRISECKSRS